MENVQRNIHTWAKDWGFWTENPNIAEKIALVHSELSEALEAHRKGIKADEHCPEHSNLAIEMADTVIRIMDLCEHLKIDLGRAILAKMEFNRTRPHKHGKAY